MNQKLGTNKTEIESYPVSVRAAKRRPGIQWKPLQVCCIPVQVRDDKGNFF